MIDHHRSVDAEMPLRLITAMIQLLEVAESGSNYEAFLFYILVPEA